MGRMGQALSADTSVEIWAFREFRYEVRITPK
jgi:hypothetical protein